MQVHNMSPFPVGIRVLIVDQWIETGGTMKAAIKLVERLGATVVGQSRWLNNDDIIQRSSAF